jgi:DNA-binding protein HU-beta
MNSKRNSLKTKEEPMNKRDLAINVNKAVDGELTLAACSRVVSTFFTEIQSALERGEKVRISGFGTMKVAGRAARKGRDPRTGEPLKIPARKVVRFHPSDHLKEAINR